MFTRLRTLFGIFFFLSLVTLGGGLAMLPAMRDEFVRKRGWMTDEEMVDTVAAMQSMPGIIACNMGVLLGYRIAGIPGALVSLLGGILPPFLAIVLVAGLVFRLRSLESVGHMFLGVRAAVSALILHAAFGLGRQVFSGAQGQAGRRFTGILTALSFLALGFLGMNAVYVLLAGGLAGWLFLLWKSRHAQGKEERP